MSFIAGCWLIRMRRGLGRPGPVLGYNYQPSTWARAILSAQMPVTGRGWAKPALVTLGSIVTEDQSLTRNLYMVLVSASLTLASSTVDLKP